MSTQSSNPTTSPSSNAIPLLANGDAYVLYVEQRNAAAFNLLKVERFADNRDATACEIKFYDLPPEIQRAVLIQIKRKHPGKTIYV